MYWNLGLLILTLCVCVHIQWLWVPEDVDPLELEMQAWMLETKPRSYPLSEISFLVKDALESSPVLVAPSEKQKGESQQPQSKLSAEHVHPQALIRTVPSRMVRGICCSKCSFQNCLLQNLNRQRKINEDREETLPGALLQNPLILFLATRENE